MGEKGLESVLTVRLDRKVKEQVAAFDACHTKRSSGMTDEEIRDARLRDRYGLGAR